MVVVGRRGYLLAKFIRLRNEQYRIGETSSFSFTSSAVFLLYMDRVGFFRIATHPTSSCYTQSRDLMLGQAIGWVTGAVRIGQKCQRDNRFLFSLWTFPINFTWSSSR